MTLANALLSCGGSLRDRGETYSANDIRIQAVQRAEQLVTRRSKVVGIDLPNSAEWAFWDIACLLAEVIAVPLPPFFTEHQRSYVQDNAGVDTLITSRSVAGGSAVGASVIVAVSGNQGYSLPDGTAKITYTSGTTGAPRGVCLSAQGMLATAQAVNSASASFAIDRHLSLLPYAVLLENVAGLYCGLMRGSCVITRATKAELGQVLTQERPNSLILVPEILKALLKLARVAPDRTQSLRFIAVGGAKTPTGWLDQARTLGLPVFEGYGLSECGSVVALHVGEAMRGSVGAPLPHIEEIRFSSDNELQVRSAAAFLGYVGEPTRRPNQWIATGDAAHLNPDGSLTMDGRLGHRIVTSRGRNVSPEWVESVLMEQDAIDQCMVTGTDNQPQLNAIVVPARGESIAAIKLAIRTANRKLPEYARISRLAVSDEPWTPANKLLTSTGKLRRAAIVDRFAKGAFEHVGHDSRQMTNLTCLSTMTKYTGDRLNDAL